MPLNVDDLVSAMATAASSSLGNSWNSVREYATAQFQQTAATVALIERDTLNGSITQAQAKNLLDIQMQATQAVMLALATMTAAAVQRALNAALDAIKEPVNAAVGFPLL